METWNMSWYEMSQDTSKSNDSANLENMGSWLTKKNRKENWQTKNNSIITKEIQSYKNNKKTESNQEKAWRVK